MSHFETALKISHFETAFKYVILNEGPRSDHPADKGGLTHWGITHEVARAHRCLIHPNGINVMDVDQNVAKHIYLEDYWELDGVESIEVAIKLFDMGVNFGTKTAGRLTQETINSMSKSNLKVDGVLGKLSCAALNKLNPQKFLDQFEFFTDDRYADIVVNDLIRQFGRERILNGTQAAFLKGWLRRSNKRFYIN